ncbi:WD40 repeat-like protein [Clathrospora elynae]|uniref:Ribosome biogenesis protein YTM1 n=1 Tax=Clathrospora elynae TaxID=706981 RepID=A0A6A5SXP1_9PLEO|nr:WD40 repeat-like protein [Clathrospora elynae]
MSLHASDDQLSHALLQSVEQGAFPQEEHVASATVPSSALPKLLEVVGKARENTKSAVRNLSREAAPDVDGWIAQARKLQNDIKRSQDTAKEIVQQAEGGKETTAHVQDAASKVSLLHSEIAYNESLAQAVEQLRDISTLLDSAQNAAVHGHVMHAIHILEDTCGAFKRLGPFGTTRVVGVLKHKEEQLKKAIVETVTDSWNGLVSVDSTNHSILLERSIKRETTVDIETVVEALTKLNLLDNFVSRLSRDLDRTIISPRLAMGSDQVVSAIDIQGNLIQRAGPVNRSSVKATLEDIHVIAEYLSTRLPPSIAIPLSSKIVPVIASRLITNLLLPAVPFSTNGIQTFQESLSYVLGLVEYLDELGWSGQNRLAEWVDKSAEIWLAKQKEAAIARVQTMFPKKLQEKKTVERVETQVISKGDALHAGSDDQTDDWGADWDEEAAPTKEQKDDVEEEDMSAWGEDDDATVEEPKDEAEVEEKPVAGEDVDDWGAEWGDENDTRPAATPKSTLKLPDQSKTNGNSASQKPSAHQEVTLRETYTVTAIPDAIIEIILQVIADVDTLNSPDLVKSAIAPASGGLYAIPSLLLAMYRATAVMHYSKDIASNMLIYNDCQRLSDRLRLFLQEQIEKDKSSALPQHLQPSVRLKPILEADIQTIDGFGKRAYGREMESQRQIIRDHLEDAQGFQGCTNVPFVTVCDDAIATTIDRIGDVKRQWQNVLSHSALLQSLGSLVSAALTKFVNDIEDMSDIAEDESRKLHGYCVSLATLSQHFQTEDGTGEMRDMASIYTPNWFKFQYLLEILDGSLADIKYFWTDGELKLEMEAEEVIGLIEALFAPSEHRRRAISEIRRTTIFGTPIATMDIDAVETKVQIRLTTRDPGLQISEEPSNLLVQTSLTRHKLSTLVNELLHRNENRIPFDILINGEFLRTTIDEFLTKNGINAETTLDVEYTRALVPPLNVTSFEHDDWVSAVDVLSRSSVASIQSGQERILSASYDGLVRVWNTSGDVLATSEAPNNGGRITSLKTAKWLSDKKMVAAGMDNTVRVYKYDDDARTITTSLELFSHRWGVEDVAVHAPSSRILSASADTTVSLFSSNAKENPVAPSTLLPNSTAASNKRQKLSKPDRTVPARGALSTLSGHSSPVSSVIFKPDDATVAHSASHDHTLKTWDLPTSTCVDTRTTGHSLLSLCAIPSRNLLATGTSARHITLVDPRASATQISVMTLRGHKNAIVSLATDPSSEYNLASGSHDGTVQIWDLRNVSAGGQVGEGMTGESVYTINRQGKSAEAVKSHGEGVKVFSVRWDRDVGIVSAGEDKKVQINRALGS